jgi:transposase
MINNSVISIDLAKNVFQVCVLSQHNKITMNKKVRRTKLLETVLNIDAKRIVMEACYSSNYWGRLFQQHGFQVDLIPPHQVKPFVMGNKNDHNDAIAIAEASMRPKSTVVAVKTLAQQDIQCLERIRDRLIKERSALANQTRGLLAEYGVIIDKTVAALRLKIPLVLEDAENSLTPIAREFTHNLYEELLSIDRRIAATEKLSESLLVNNDDYRRLQTIPGIGPVTSRGIICAINDAKQFKNGRQMSAWVGLTPKQHASGEVTRMGGISKRGNRVLRRQFNHGARAVIRWCEEKDDALSMWLKKLLKTKPKCKVIVALANKLARIAWAVLAKGEEYNAKMLLVPVVSDQH